MSKLSTLNRQFISNLDTHKVITDAKRNLILSILKSTTTKREAKNYLTKYQNQFDFSSSLEFNRSIKSINEQESLTKRDIQRELFINRYLNRRNPFINIYDNEEVKYKKIPLRIALFKIKVPSITPKEWQGITETFKRLITFGISPIIILDYDHFPHDSFKHNELYMIDVANKLLNYLGKPEAEGDLKATIARSLFTSRDGVITMDSLESILIPLYQGLVPIIQPFVYNAETSYQELIEPDNLLYSLSSALLERGSKDLLTIEKIVMIDPIGGIPSIERNQSSHVFINLSQEYSDIISELYIGHIEPKNRDLHLQNLNSMNNILSFINEKSGNDEATGIITTPEIMSINSDELNPIIYNVLTDRPIISSSLPSSNTRTQRLSTSVIKKGVDVQIFDQDDYHREFTLKNLFEDKLVDKDRLVALMNDSFGKELDVDSYLSRINNDLATLVIVGDYDGGAIITWEYSQGEKIAYLDKFAIAKKNQGLPGLADIIFKIILQSHPNELIWRSRKVNPVNKWYFERCCGCMSSPESQWKIFYTGEIFNKKIKRYDNKIVNGDLNIGKKLKQYSEICESIPPSFI
ncbi:ARG2 [[Candida] subhashii]|uniref:Amino-acid acetyltransferase, mitochondrial n=1 Tax=[Candida] subhashii TaxID=561895 RepID=A0A8J5QLH9_9ASCO|nr:ARG2 [[Candida] subhashii]KAG7660730.1 ARG2 [[Candida] subhashii]